MGKLFLFLSWSLYLPVVCLTAQQQEYRITETQIQSIETSLEKLERDRRSWELQAQGLRSEAVNLNRLLAAEREQYRTLEQSFTRYEASQSEQAAALKREAAEARLETEKYKGKANTRLAVIIALAGAWVIYGVFLAVRTIRYFYGH